MNKMTQTDKDLTGEAGSATDPVCGMSVEIDGAKHVTTHEGVHYYFCHAGCQTKFETEPRKYLEPQPESARFVSRQVQEVVYQADEMVSTLEDHV